MKWEPTKTAAVVLAWPDMLVSPCLLYWLEDIGISRGQIAFTRSGDYDISVAYNRAIVMALATPAEWFLFADKDIFPSPQSTADFVTDGRDVVCARSHRRGLCYRHDGAFHTNLWRCHRKVLEAILAPWFTPPVDATGSRWVSCVCTPFANKVRAAGFSIGWAGTCAHQSRREQVHLPESLVYRPTRDGKAGRPPAPEDVEMYCVGRFGDDVGLTNRAI